MGEMTETLARSLKPGSLFARSILVRVRYSRHKSCGGGENHDEKKAKLTRRPTFSFYETEGWNIENFHCNTLIFARDSL